MSSFNPKTEVRLYQCNTKIGKTRDMELRERVIPLGDLIVLFSEMLAEAIDLGYETHTLNFLISKFGAIQTKP